MKPSTVWMIAGVLITIYLVNHWMSREINQPMPPARTQAVETPVNDAPENQAPALTIPGVPINEKIIESINTAPAPKAVGQKTQVPSEPVYEPPGNSIILIQ